MAFTVAKLNVLLSANSVGFNRELQKASKQLDNFAKKAREVSKKAAIALAGISGAGIYMIKVASDAQELSNVINKTFGSMADDIDSWANTLSKQVGRSRYQLRQFAGTAGAMLKPMVGSTKQAAEMSKTIAQLAVDMGSFFNVADEEAFAALRAGLVGETEPLRRFGIVLTEAQLQAYALAEGIGKSVREMTEAEKVTLRYNYILDRTADLHGDARDTANSFQNLLKGLSGDIRNIAEDYGVRLLPAAEEVLKNVRDLVRWFGDLDDKTKDNIVRIGAITSAVLGAVVAFGLLVTAASAVVKGIVLLGGVFGIITSPIVLGIGAIAAGATLLYTAWTENWGGIQEKTLAVWRTIEPIWDTVTEDIKVVWKWTAKQLGNAWDWLSGPAWSWIKDTAWPVLKESFSAAWRWVAKQAGNAWSWLSGPAWDWIKDVAWPKIKESFSAAWQWTAKQAGNAWAWLSGPAWTWVKDTAWPKLQESAKTVWNWVAKQAGNAWDWLSGPAWTWIRDTAWPKLQESARTVWQWVAKQAGNAWEWLTGPALDFVKDPSFEKLKEGFETVWRWIVDRKDEALNWVKENVIPWLDKTAETTWRIVVETVEEVTPGVVGRLRGLREWIQERRQEIREMAKQEGIGIWEAFGVLTEAEGRGKIPGLVEVGVNIASIIKEGFLLAWDFTALLGDIGVETVAGITRKFIELGNTIANSIMEGIQEIFNWENLSTFILDIIPDWIKDAVGGVQGAFQKFVNWLTGAEKHHEGAILPGTSGPDQFLALLAPGEAVVPAKAVQKGWPGVLAWFREQGVPGFQAGMVPTVTTGNPEIDSQLRTASTWIQDISRTMNTMFAGIKDAIVGFFTMLGDLLLGLVDRLFPAKWREISAEEYRYLYLTLGEAAGDLLKKEGGKYYLKTQAGLADNIRAFWEDMKARFTGILEAFDSMGQAAETGTQKQEDNTEAVEEATGFFKQLTESIRGLPGRFKELNDQIKAMKFEDWAKHAKSFVYTLADTLRQSSNAIARGFGDIISFVMLAFEDLQSAIGAVVNAIATSVGRLLSGDYAAEFRGMTARGVEMFPKLGEMFKNFREWDKNLDSLIRKQKAIDVATVGGGLAGGLLGFFLGGPIGALLGAGLGAFGGRAVAQANLGPQIEELKKKLGDTLQKIKEVLGTTISDIARSLASAFSAETYDDFVSGFARTLREQTQRALITAFMASETVRPLLENLSDIITFAVEDFKITAEEQAGIESAFEQIVETAKPFYEALKSLTFASEDAADGMDKVSGALRNIPSGFKVALRRFQVAQPRYSAELFVDQTDVMTSGAKETTVIINFNGDVYGTDDFEGKIEEAVDKIKQNVGLTEYGLTTA